jgi:hypothetical protein
MLRYCINNDLIVAQTQWSNKFNSKTLYVYDSYALAFDCSDFSRNSIQTESVCDVYFVICVPIRLFQRS